MEKPGKNIPFEEVERLLEMLKHLESENQRLRQENQLLREKVDFILRPGCLGPRAKSSIPGSWS
jgi:hypothetical protein